MHSVQRDENCLMRVCLQQNAIHISDVAFEFVTFAVPWGDFCRIVNDGSEGRGGNNLSRSDLDGREESTTLLAPYIAPCNQADCKAFFPPQL